MTQLRYEAHINPQAWRNDYAISVDPPGQTSWDCTDYVVADSDLKTRVDEEIMLNGYFLDRSDEFFYDPANPEWVKHWQGPFTITVKPKLS